MSVDKNNLPSHVAITMDGNGRWATARKLPRTAGHDQGLHTVKKIVKSARLPQIQNSRSGGDTIGKSPVSVKKM